ncbi:AIPR family protein [Candidatus Pantoea bituminis]|uniref:AIPR family protein n=1 Tax=Candidatus Pantoea bituminis TaxID=2831036 RepID=UPI00211132FB|nr:AIPR family protein [Pantoea bituminis]
MRRYLFESNVRDFMGLNAVNEDIKSTLSDQDSPDFWLLNNGVTILSTSAQLIGQSIYMEDIQIVNGLQTSESIFRYFDDGGSDQHERAVMVKVIVSSDESVRDQIIRATNNQTAVEQYSLHATERIQKDVEEILLRNGFFMIEERIFIKIKVFLGILL